MTRPGPDFATEEEFRAAGCLRIAGVDEAGRGRLAGPVTAAAVVLKPGDRIEGLDDSKRLSPAEREALEAVVKERALTWSVGWCSPAEIDRLNILHAAMEAMRRAVAALAEIPDALLIDGNRSFDRPGVACRTLVGGDGRSVSIAAASIIAKTARDRLMLSLHDAYPEYAWASNKGYPTRAHFEALARIGRSPHHRRSFALLRAEDLQHKLFEPA